MPACPKCRVPLVAVEESNVTAFACAQCRGTWISGKALKRRVRMERSAAAATAKTQPHIADLARTVTESDTAKPLTCADCHKVMTKDRFHAMIPIQIDRCESCGYIWLDAGEQGLLLRLYRELITTDDAPIAEKRAKLNRLERLRRRPEMPQLDNTMQAINIGMTVVRILLDVFLFAGSHYRRRRW